MSWQVSAQTIGGYRVTDTETDMAVATAVQREITLFGGITSEQALKNARLISAAPDLLESLVNLVGLARSGAAHLGKYHAALTDAEAAIAKSYGQQ